MHTRPRAAKWIAIAIAGLFGSLLCGIFLFDKFLDAGHHWVRIEDDAIYRYVPSGMRLVTSDHSGWAIAQRCPAGGRCEYNHYFAGPFSVAETQQLVERELLAAGFVLRPGTQNCGARSDAARYVKGEISVWPTFAPTPFRLGRTQTIGPHHGRSVVRLSIDNMQLVWGC